MSYPEEHRLRECDLSIVKLARDGHVDEINRLATDPTITEICAKALHNFRVADAPGQLHDLENKVRLKVQTRITRAKKEFESVRNYYAWVRKIAENELISDYHENQTLSSFDALVEMPNQVCQTPPYELQVLIREIAEKAATLEPLDQTILLLLSEGDTVAEIAERLRCSRQTVYRHWARILEELAPWNPYCDTIEPNLTKVGSDEKGCDRLLRASTQPGARGDVRKAEPEREENKCMPGANPPETLLPNTGQNDL